MCLPYKSRVRACFYFTNAKAAVVSTLCAGFLEQEYVSKSYLHAFQVYPIKIYMQNEAGSILYTYIYSWHIQ